MLDNDDYFRNLCTYLQDTTNITGFLSKLEHFPLMSFDNRVSQTCSLLEEKEFEERSESELEDGTAETPYGICQPFSAVPSSGHGSGIASNSASCRKSPL